MKKSTTLTTLAATVLCASIMAPAAANASIPSAVTNTVNTTTGSATSAVSSTAQPASGVGSGLLSGVSGALPTVLPTKMSTPAGVLGSDSRVTTTWTAASDLVSALVGGYKLTELVNGVPASATVLPTSATSYTSSVLPGGTNYATQLSAINALGDGPISDTSNLLTVGVSPSTSVGSGTTSAVTSSTDTSTSSLPTPAASPISNPAPSAAPTSTPSAPVRIIRGVPSAPALASPKVSRQAVTFKWVKSKVKNSAVKAYAVRLYEGQWLVKSLNLAPNRLSVKVANLHPRTKYTIKVAALSKHGKISKWSAKTFRTR